MRDIKFRAWGVEQNKFLSIGFSLGDASGYNCDHSNSNAYFGTDKDAVDVDLIRYGKTIVEQFTGLYDKNGKEIYEGDICHYWQSIDGKNGTGFHRNLVVDNYETGPLFRVTGLGKYEGPYTTYKMGEMLTPRPFDNVRGNLEIIGNIHENPELLKESA